MDGMKDSSTSGDNGGNAGSSRDKLLVPPETRLKVPLWLAIRLRKNFGEERLDADPLKYKAPLMFAFIDIDMGVMAQLGSCVHVAKIFHCESI